MDAYDEGRMLPDERSTTDVQRRSPERDPLEALQAVALVVKPLRRELAARALEAREQGHPWRAIANALALVGPIDVTSQHAYDVVKAACGGGGWWCDLEEITWRCVTCDQPVVDHGPEDGERGHEPTCPRRVIMGGPLTVLQ